MGINHDIAAVVREQYFDNQSIGLDFSNKYRIFNASTKDKDSI